MHLPPHALLAGPPQQQQLPALQVLALDSSPQHGHGCCPDHENGHGHAHQHSHEHAGPSGMHSHQHNHTHHTGHTTTTTSSSSSGSSLTLERASQLVRCNAFGDAFEDLAAAAVRGAAMPHSHVGCWPAFSLFNHSCVPNTVHYVVGQQMVVRATEDVPAGAPRCCPLLFAATQSCILQTVSRLFRFGFVRRSATAVLHRRSQVAGDLHHCVTTDKAASTQH
jgi:hypothetical protein